MVGDLLAVEGDLHIEHGLLGWLQYCVETAQDCHRQNDVAVLPAHINVTKDIVGDIPDEIGKPVEFVLIH